MENQDHYAFVESMLDDETLSFGERWELEEELLKYYRCLALQYEEQFADNDLTEDEKELAYQEYANLRATSWYAKKCLPEHKS